jgi:SOS-response transcriptional repressor LexA
MSDAGIHPGDVVIVEKRASANVGDIVVAIIDNEFTLKPLHKERGRLVLKPESKSYPVIRPKGELEIFGVVVGLFRTYRKRENIISKKTEAAALVVTTRPRLALRL